MKSSWNKQHRYNGPDCWRYHTPEPVSFPAIAIVKHHERVIAKIWGPLNLSDTELLDLVQNEYADSSEIVVERLSGQRMVLH